VQPGDTPRSSVRRTSRARTPHGAAGVHTSRASSSGVSPARSDRSAGNSRLGLLEDGTVRIAIGKRAVRLHYPPDVRQDIGQSKIGTQRSGSLSSCALPNFRLQLQWAYGYSGSFGGNLFFSGKDEVVYPVAACVVVYNIVAHTQRFFTGHDDLVTSLAVHRDMALSCQRAGRGRTQPYASLWRVSDQVELARLIGCGTVSSVAFSDSGSHVYVTGVNSQGGWQVCVWKVDKLVKSASISSEAFKQTMLRGTPSLSDEPVLRVPLQLMESVQGLAVHPETDAVALIHGMHTLGFVTMPMLVSGAPSRIGSKPSMCLADYGGLGAPAGIACATFVGSTKRALGVVYAAVGTTDGRVLMFAEDGAWRAVTALRLVDEGLHCRVDFVKPTAQGFVCGGGSDCGLNFFGSDLELIRERVSIRTTEGKSPQLVDALYMETDHGTELLLGTHDGTILKVDNANCVGDLVATVISGPHGAGDKPDHVDQVTTAVASHPVVATRVASGDTLGHVFFYDTGECEVLRSVPPYKCRAAIGCLTYAPGGGLLAAGLADGSLELISVTEWGDLEHSAFGDRDFRQSRIGECARNGMERRAPGMLSTCPDAHFACTPRLHDVVQVCADGEAVTAVEFSPGAARHLAVASTDGTVTLVTCEYGCQTDTFQRTVQLQQVALLRGGMSAVLAVQFSADGRFLATSGRDSPLSFWDVQTAQRLSDSMVQESDWFAVSASGGSAHEWHMPVGWPVVGLCNRSHANLGLLIKSAKKHQLCMASSDPFDIALYRFPLPVEGAKGVPYLHHGSKAICCCWTNDDVLLTSSSRCNVLLQWRLVCVDEPPEPVPKRTESPLGLKQRMPLLIRRSSKGGSGISTDSDANARVPTPPESTRTSTPVELANGTLASLDRESSGDCPPQPESARLSHARELEEARKRLQDALSQNEALQRRNQELERKEAEHYQERLDFEQARARMEERKSQLRRLIPAAADEGSGSSVSLAPAAPRLSNARPAVPALALAASQGTSSQSAMTPDSHVLVKSEAAASMTDFVERNSTPRQPCASKEMAPQWQATSPNAITRLPSSPYLGSPGGGLKPASPRPISGLRTSEVAPPSLAPQRLKSAPMPPFVTTDSLTSTGKALPFASPASHTVQRTPSTTSAMITNSRLSKPESMPPFAYNRPGSIGGSVERVVSGHMPSSPGSRHLRTLVGDGAPRTPLLPSARSLSPVPRSPPLWCRGAVNLGSVLTSIAGSNMGSAVAQPPLHRSDGTPMPMRPLNFQPGARNLNSTAKRVDCGGAGTPGMP